MTVYFLSGLGSNRYHAYDLQEALGESLICLELPGHGLEYDTPLNSLEELVTWFSEKIAPSEQEEIVLIAHSMGANLAPYLASQIPQIQRLVLLDGGYIDFDQLVTLEEEVQDTKAYLEEMVFDNMETLIEEEKNAAPYWSEHTEQALRESFTLVDGRYRLALKEETVLSLLALQRQASGYLRQVNCPTLLIPQTDEETPTWKTEMLASVPSHITVDNHLNCGHSPHTEQPRATADSIHAFLNKNKT